MDSIAVIVVMGLTLFFVLGFGIIGYICTAFPKPKKKKWKYVEDDIIVLIEEPNRQLEFTVPVERTEDGGEYIRVDLAVARNAITYEIVEGRQLTGPEFMGFCKAVQATQGVEHG